MNMDKAKQALLEAVPAAAEARLAAWDVRVEAVDGCVYLLHLSHCDVRIMLEWITISTWLKPVPAAGGPAFQDVQVDISWIKEPAEIRAEVERQLSYIATKYAAVLSGDSHGWPTAAE
jgi:hypothetical protein